MSTRPFREPTPDERSGIVDAILLSAGFDVYDFEAEQIESNIAVIGITDGYITDCPGYSGPVAVVLFTGGPEIKETLTFRDGEWSVCGGEQA